VALPANLGAHVFTDNGIILSTGLIFDIKRFSIHDGPGIRTTVFLKGCPLACRWCHNPESQVPEIERMFRPDRCVRCGACLTACTVGAISQNGQSFRIDDDKCTLCGACAEACYAEAREMVGRRIEVSVLMHEIEQDIVFYDQSGGGVTISGGEPLMQPHFLRDLLKACRKAEIHTALDTCGFAAWETLDAIRQYVDLFLYDLKPMDDRQHREFTGVSNQPILRNLLSLSQLGHDIILRIPVIPGITDGDKNIQRLAAFVAKLPRLQGIDLLPYHGIAADKYKRLGKEYTMRDIHPPTRAELLRIRHLFAEQGLHVRTGG
jgi:pyruvate formate lyase activating enzyme